MQKQKNSLTLFGKSDEEQGKPIIHEEWESRRRAEKLVKNKESLFMKNGKADEERKS